MSYDGIWTPNLDEKSTKVLNLTVLQRIDPFVEEILMTAAHVTFYAFNIETSQWSRKDVEGSLFVVKRNTQPRFQFIVMNRRNTDNLVENLLGDFEYEVQVPYLLYRNAAQEVNGIWFYNPRECEEIANLFSRILTAYSKVPTKSQLSATKSEFEDLEAFPTMVVMDGLPEPSASTTPNVTDVSDDPSFVNFFSVAMNLGNTPNAAIHGQSYQLSARISRSSHPPTLTAVQTPSPLNKTESINCSKHSSDLVKPSSFFGPPPSSSPIMMPTISSSVPTASPLNPPRNLQQPYGAPLLQSFPPSTPPPSFTPTSVPMPNYGPVINRDKVRQALMMLVKDNQLIDMVYQAMKNAHSL